MPGESSTRILIVDDEVAQMQALCDTLRDEGYITTGFTSAKEGLASLRNQAFDLLLTDLMMPEMNGIALLRAALALDENLVGIVMTAHATIDTAIEAMKAGALDYIVKPFKLTVILPVLSRALTVRKLRMQNAELERCVRERTLALEAANQKLESFSYSVSHDLRAPLRVIDGFSQILLNQAASNLSERHQQLLRRICDNVSQMAQLIEGLLSLARLERQSLSIQPLSPSSSDEESN
jgi:hypothetical protein